MFLKFDSKLSTRAALAVILMAGACLRFYQLETPSLWWDEILVPLTSSHSLAYILDFCRSAEMHPPLFYLISKAALSFGGSDFALRLLPALLGMASIYLLYRVVRAFTDDETALMAAAILSVSGLHVLLSREIRPYALQMVLLLFAWKLVVDLVRHGRWRDLALLCGLDAVLFWLHYFTFHMVFAQGTALLLFAVFQRGGAWNFKRLAVFCGVIAALAAPVFFLFFLPSSGSRSIFADARHTRWDVLELVRTYLGQVLFFFDVSWVRIAAAALAAGGFLALAARRPRLAVVSLILLAVPLVNVLVLRKVAYFSPWHVAYTAPFLALFLASALSRMPGAKAVAAGLAAAGAVFILSTQHARYYEVDSYRHNVFVTLFKPVARELATLLPAGGVSASSNPGFANGVNWYLDQYSAPNPLREQTLEPDSGASELRFLSAFHDFGTLARDEAAFLATMGRPSRVEKAVNATVYTFPLERRPVTSLDALPFRTTFGGEFKDFYARVSRLRNVTFCPMPGIGVTATGNDRPGTLEFALENVSGERPMRFFVTLQYQNIGRENQLGLYYRFDDEPPVPLAGSLGPDDNRQVQAVFQRDKPFKKLTFLVELHCRGLTAQYHGGNLETLAFRGLDVFACPADDAASCQTAWERNRMESLRLNYGAQAFLGRSSVKHTAAFDAAVNVDDAPSQEAPGWRVLSPREADKPATLSMEVAPGGRMVFYPRLSGSDASIQVFELTQDGTRRPVFMMAGVDNDWTPISGQYLLSLPEGGGTRKLEVELRGRFSQLWHKDGKILF